MKIEYRVYYQYGQYIVNRVDIYEDGSESEFTEGYVNLLNEALRYIQDIESTPYGVRII